MKRELPEGETERGVGKTFGSTFVTEGGESRGGRRRSRDGGKGKGCLDRIS